MSNLTDHAKKELELAGLFNQDSDYEGMLGNAVMELIEEFAGQGHSGFSANMTVTLFEKVARFLPLAPLTGEDDEWNEIAVGLYQNKRCSHVFRDTIRGDGDYDIDGKVFREPNGVCYTNKDSHVPITFPYVPKTEYVDVEAK